MDRAEWGEVAGSAGGVSFPGDVLASTTRLGRARCVADDLADVSG